MVDEESSRMHDAARWMAGLSSLIGFGLAMGLNPALYGATADMLARDVRTAPRLLSMLAGLATGATVLYLALRAFDPTSLVDTIERDLDQALLDRVVDVVAGAVFALLGIVVLVWRLLQPDRPPREQKPPAAKGRLANYFALGVSSSIVGFTTFPLMYLTGRVTTSLADDLLGRALAYGVFLIALVAPFIAIAWLWTKLPRLSHRVTDLYSAAMHKDYRIAIAVLLLAAGVGVVLWALLRQG